MVGSKKKKDFIIHPFKRGLGTGWDISNGHNLWPVGTQVVNMHPENDAFESQNFHFSIMNFGECTPFDHQALASAGLLAAKSAICKSAFWGNAVNKALNFPASAEPIILAKASLIAAQSALEVTKPGLLMALSNALSWAATAAWMSLGSIVKPVSKTLSKAVATPLGFLAEISEMYLGNGLQQVPCSQ